MTQEKILEHFTKDKPALITGCYRSGTSLLAHLLLTSVPTAMQPGANLWYHVMDQFHQRIGSSEYALSSLFPRHYTESSLLDFINEFRFKASDQNLIAEKIDANFGNYSQGEFQLPFLKGKSVLTSYGDVVKQISNSCWTKEILFEELIPFFIHHGWQAGLIVRDPRDMVASVQSGDQLGTSRPTLFHLLNWRKSAAYYLCYRQSEEVLTLTYESLIEENKGNAINFSNSNFTEYDDVSSASIGRYKEVLDTDQLDFVEQFCELEMKALGYLSAQEDSRYDASFLKAYQDPFEVEHSRFGNFAEEKNDILRLDLERRNQLKENLISENDEDLFVTTGVFEILKAFVRG